MKDEHQAAHRRGFTLIEILLVVAIIGILAGVVILAINPQKQLGEARDAARHTDVTTILNAVYQYYIDTGTLPSSIVTSTLCPGPINAEICKTSTCNGYTDLSVLTDDQKYVVSIPFDPNASTVNGTSYFIVKSGNNRVTVCAPGTEQSAMISVTR